MVDDIPPISLPDLRYEVLAMIRQVPPGQVTTYGDLARGLGDDQSRAARWVGEFLKHHPHIADCPCHRVVRSNGEIGRHVSGDAGEKARLLKREGIVVFPSGHVDLASRWTDFHSTRPLARLRNFQQELARRMRPCPLESPPRTLAGLDVAYRNDGLACGAYVELDIASMQTIREVTVTLPAEFPYIPGYLTFRELPVMLELCRRAGADRPLADVLFVDGNGLLHPWRAGIALCLGVLLDHPTLGIGKSLLCGSVDRKSLSKGESATVSDRGAVIGMALSSKRGSRPIYVSLGHRILLSEAAALVGQATTQHRVPEPIYRADRLTKDRARN